MHNKLINSKRDAWLLFLCSDLPEDIIHLIEQFPEFKPMYEEIYNICQNLEGVMNMFSKELQILDQNTVKYMIDEMKDTIDEQQNTISEQSNTISEQNNTISDLKQQLAEQNDTIWKLLEKFDLLDHN